MRKINLILPFLALSLLVSCSNNSTSIVESSIETISTSVVEQEEQASLIGLPYHSYELKITNPDKSKIENLEFDNELMDVENLSYKAFKVTLYNQFNGTSDIKFKKGELEQTIPVSCVDLKITNSPYHVNLNEPTEITLNKDVDAKYSVKGDNVSINGNKVTSSKEGTFAVIIDYGNIHLEQIFDSYSTNNQIKEMTRDNPYMKLHGRNYHEGGYVHLDNEGSGFTVTFKGTKLEALLTAPFGSWYGETYVNVVVDSNDPEQGKQVCLSHGSSLVNYTLVSGLEDTVHTVKVLKSSEALSSWMSLYSISTDGQFFPIENKDVLKIEAYGDSITAGYGNLRGALSDTTSSKLQSGLQTWASYTAWNLDADINILARSGIGLYTAANMQEGENICDLYSKVALDGEHNWRLDNYIPDIVLINLGTNDFWNGAATNKFVSHYESLVVDLAQKYGEDTSFVFASGFMEDTVYDNLLTIQRRLQNSLSNKLYTYEFDRCNAGHPLFTEHKVGALGLTELIEENHLNIIHETQNDIDTLENTLNVVLQDEIPDYCVIEATINSQTFELIKENNFLYSTFLELAAGEYEVTFSLKGDGDYTEIGNPKYTIKVDGTSSSIITLRPFKSFPKDTTPDPYYGWSASTHLFDCSFNPTSESDVSVSNINWKAGCIVRDPIRGDSYSLSVHIQSDATDYTDKYVGLIPYFIDDSTFVMIYLQWTSGKKLKSIGCTGLNNNADIGWHDYWTFENVIADLSEGVDLSISRNRSFLTMNAFGLSETQSLSVMSGDTSKVGVWQYMTETVNYTNFTQLLNS